jgi:hypothetical protein
MKRAGNRRLTSEPQRTSPLRRLRPLVGSWRLSGRTLNSSRDDLRGSVTIDWVPGGHLLQIRSEIHVGKFSVHSLEIVTFDPVSKTFPSFVYSCVEQMPLLYSWKIRGKRVEHSGLGATFRGTLTNRERILSGKWQADRGVEPSPQNTYSATMTRVR